MPIAKEIKKGQLVKSRAGRDKNRDYLVYAWDDQYVFVVDGEYRRMTNPKKKNLNHLWYAEKVDRELNEKMNNNTKITNKDIRDALERLLNQS